jgi:membrane-associated phospholipid phosphatase
MDLFRPLLSNHSPSRIHSAIIRDVLDTVFSFLILLAMQIVVFYVFPVRIPAAWREYNPNASLSHRMLAFIQRYDSFSNSIPSMHVSVATLTALHLYSNLNIAMGAFAPLVFTFPVAIALSAIFTKQHYVADLAPGAVFGWLAYRAADLIVAL